MNHGWSTLSNRDFYLIAYMSVKNGSVFYFRKLPSHDFVAQEMCITLVVAK